MQTPAKLKYTLLMLSRNEIEGMRAVFPRIDKSLLHEVVVIDGGSTDGSIEFAESYGFRVVHQKSRGVIEGFKEGLEAVTGDVMIGFTPDNNMLPEKIPELIAKMEEGYDMVTVSRYLDDAKSDDDHVVSAFGNWMFTTMVNVLFGSKYTDVLGFYRAYRPGLIKDLDIEVKLSIDTQLCIRCRTRGKRVTEIPGDEPARIGGASSRSIIYNGLIELHTILWEFVKWKFGRG